MFCKSFTTLYYLTIVLLFFIGTTLAHEENCKTSYERCNVGSNECCHDLQCAQQRPGSVFVCLEYRNQCRGQNAFCEPAMQQVPCCGELVCKQVNGTSDFRCAAGVAGGSGTGGDSNIESGASSSFYFASFIAISFAPLLSLF